MSAAEIAMPRLSDSMEEGTILAWRKQVGEEVEIGEELAEIETDKANMAYEADIAGTLLEILVPEGQSAPVGAPIARVGASGAEVSLPAPSPEQRSAANGRSNGIGSGERLKASPLARRIAREAGVDLASLRGSGPGGRIVKRDVKGAAAAAKAPSPAPGSPESAKGAVETQELTKLQETVARRMAESKATAPHFYLSAEVDMGAAVRARAQIKEISGEEEVIPSFNDMVVKACAIALRRFPRANGSYRDGRFELHSRVNIGIAVAAKDALVVPTIFDAERKGLREIAEDSRTLASRVRAGQITPPQLSGATFTVSNLGMFGIRSFDAVINSPQAAILAVGEIADRPAVRNGEIVPAKLMEITLSCDHRILYGAEGAELLAAVKGLLEEPVGLAL